MRGARRLLVLAALPVLALVVTNASAAGPGLVNFSGGDGSFGSVQVGQSGSQTITITATTDAVAIGSIGTTGDNAFSVPNGTDACTNTTLLLTGDHCDIVVKFGPTSSGAASSTTLNVPTNNGTTSGTETMNLSGTGTAPPAADASLTGGPLSFTAPANTASSSQHLTLTNTGTATLNISSISVASGDSTAFHSNDTCGSTLGPGNSCQITVTFGPMPAGSYSSALQVSDDASSGSPQTANLTGTSTAPAWQATPTSLAFAPNINTSQQLPVTIKNTGNGDMHIGSVSLSGTDASQFTANTGCTSKTVAPNATCTVQVTFAAQPSAAPRSASLDFTDDAGGPHHVPLTGAAQAPGFGQSPVSLAFPGMQVGIRGSTLVEAITNTGNRPLNLGPVSIGGYNKFAFLKVGDGCSNKILAPNATCNIGVRVAARVAGAQNAFILVPNDAPGTPDAHVLLTGTGLIPRAPAPLTIATGCNSVRLAWGAPVGAYRFLGTRVVRNAARVPRGPLDGVAVPHGPGAALNIRLGTFTTYNYGVWGVYGTWDGSGIHYSKRQARTVRTGRVCSPRNNSVTTDRTPLVTWLPFGSGPADYGFNLVRADHLILQGLPKSQFYQFRSAWTFKGHRYSLGPGVYTMFIFGYNAAHRTGILIGAVTFTVR